MSATELKHPLGEVVQARVDELKSNPWNPRRISESAMESLKKSITEDSEGLRDRPLIALPDGTVIAGNMRMTAARELGWETIPTVFRDYDDTHARIVALRDNNPYGEWDDALLGPILVDIEEAGFDLDLTGFTLEALDAYRAGNEDEPGADPLDRGSDLALADVSIGDPKTEVADGDVWTLGHHVLVVAGVYDGWDKWVGHLAEGKLFVPYPTPTVTLTTRAEENPLVLVQPDTWLAGHLIDKYQAVKGKKLVKKVDRDDP